MTTFHDRQKDLFNQLNAAEKQANFYTRSSNNEVRGENRLNVRRQMRQTRAELKQFRGKESIFKRPEAPLAHCLRPKNLAGYQKNPDKWVCYNLENVPNISEKSNAEAAALCLQEIVSEKNYMGDDDQSISIDDSKVVFRPPIISPEMKISLDEEKKSIQYKNSIIIYPEHVVGRKNKDQKKEKPKIKQSKESHQLKLDHLLEDEDE